MEERRVRICDLAEELGLSTATVSNVIHGKTKKVSDATVQRVTALLEERDALVRVTLSSICTSDLHIKHGSVPRALPGTTVGHEMVGIEDHRRVCQRPRKV